jgi:hypothetical protein
MKEVAGTLPPRKSRSPSGRKSQTAKRSAAGNIPSSCSTTRSEPRIALQPFVDDRDPHRSSAAFISARAAAGQV